MGILEVVHEHYEQIGWKKGIEQAIEQASKQAEQALLEKDRTLVSRMIHARLPDDDIVTYSGLSLAFVQEVCKELMQAH